MSNLFNYQSFPEYVFRKADLNYLFLPFNVVFDNDFLFRFRKFLEKHNILTISIENVKPNEFQFTSEVSVNQMPNSFKQCVSTDDIKAYGNTTISFQMLTEQGLIYASAAEELFCIVLERNYWIAIIGLSNSSDVHFFTEFAEENIIDHLSNSLNSEQLSQQLIRTAKTNWK